MPVRKTVVPRKKTPPKYIVTNERGSHYVGGSSEDGAIAAGAKLLQPRGNYRTVEVVGIYRLIKVLRPKETPIEVEEVSCCEDAR